MKRIIFAGKTASDVKRMLSCEPGMTTYVSSNYLVLARGTTTWLCIFKDLKLIAPFEIGSSKTVTLRMQIDPESTNAGDVIALGFVGPGKGDFYLTGVQISGISTAATVQPALRKLMAASSVVFGTSTSMTNALKELIIKLEFECVEDEDGKGTPKLIVLYTVMYDGTYLCNRVLFTDASDPFIGRGGGEFCFAIASITAVGTPSVKIPFVDWIEGVMYTEAV